MRLKPDGTLVLIDGTEIRGTTRQWGMFNNVWIAHPSETIIDVWGKAIANGADWVCASQTMYHIKLPKLELVDNQLTEGE